MIDGQVIAGRIPRLGTISTGRGTASSGKGQVRPTKSDTLVFHTNDAEVANAVQVAFGGDIVTESPTWAFDVVTDVREVAVGLLPAGFRMWLESWKVAECVRRCTGVRMVTANGRPVDQPCQCAVEIERGADRVCKPHTTLPVLVDLDVARFGVWEIRSTSWGTANNAKGALEAIMMLGVREGQVPGVISMQKRTVRDVQGKVRNVTEIGVGIAESHRALVALAEQGGAPAVGPGAVEPAEIEAGDPVPDEDEGEVEQSGDRDGLYDEWTMIYDAAREKGCTAPLTAAWNELGHSSFDELSIEELSAWVVKARKIVDECQTAES